jgi:hypothetical protein
MFDQMFRRQQPNEIDSYEQDLYAKFRVLGANISKLKRLGLGIPELEQLLDRLETLHDKKLVRFITDVAHFRAQEEKHNSGPICNTVLKTCPRCTRNLTGTNIIRDRYSGDIAAFVVVCECGYVRELRRSTIKMAAKQTSLDEYSTSMQIWGQSLETTDAILP